MIPPTTTSARGFCTCEPIPFDTAAGMRPTAATTQVMTTGRIWTRQVRTIASDRSIPEAIMRLK